MRNSELENKWRELLFPVFPEQSEIKWDQQSNQYRLIVWWKLNSDPDRPNKPSKYIHIIISDDVVDDYINKSENKQKEDDQKLKDYVVRQFNDHDPNHENKREEVPPKVECIAGTNVLNT